MIHAIIFFSNEWGRRDLSPGSLLGGDQALPLGHKALGTYYK